MYPRLAVLAAVVAAALPAVAGAQKPYTPPAVTIKVTPNPTVFSTPVTVTGKVAGAKAGVTVTLQGKPAGSSTWTTRSTGKTDKKGNYRLGHRPAANIYYRVLAATQPATQSAEVLERVRMLVGFRVSDLTPAAGSRVRFTGIVRPPHNGRRAYIQKQSSTGRWVTVAGTTLRALDSKSSRYRRVLRVRRSGNYRVRVLGHTDHAMGISRTRTLTVH